MNPNQPDYNFILKGSTVKASGGLAPKTQKQRLMLVGFIAGSVLLLIIGAMIIVSLLSVDDTKKFTDLATTQNEIQRIMDLGAAGASSSSVKSIAQSASSTIASHKKRTMSIGSKKGVKISDKQLIGTKSTEPDNVLLAAKNTDNYDEVFMKIYQQELAAYSKKLQTLRGSENDKTFKSALDEFTANTTLLYSYASKTMN